MTDPARFLREFARARATVAYDISGGVVLRHVNYPLAHDHNTGLLWERASPETVLSDLERHLADAAHRRCEVDGVARISELAAAFAAAGYEREPQLIMTADRAATSDRPAPDDTIESIGLDGRVAVAAAWPDDSAVDPEVRRQLAERIRTAVLAANCTFFVARGNDSRVEARTDLFVRGDTAQIEEVVTVEAARGRGHASRLVAAARATALAAGATTIFLVAEADDWPRRLYDRLGFDVTGERDVWSRQAT